MKTFSKLFSAVLASTMVVGMSIGAFADGGVDTGILDDQNTYDIEESFIKARASRRKSKRLGVTRYKQDDTKWCWAAAVQMIANYETGDSPSQRSIVTYIKDEPVNEPGSTVEVVNALKHIDDIAFENADHWKADTLKRFEKYVQTNHDKGHPTALWCRGGGDVGHVFVVEMSKGKYVELIDPWKKNDNEVYSKEELVNTGFYCRVLGDEVTSRACVVY